MASVRTDFHWGPKLGAGAFGCVFRVIRHADGLSYVIKEIQIETLGRREQESALKEVQLLASADHPHVVAYLDSFVDEGKLHIVMELCEGGDVHAMLQARNGKLLAEAEVWRYYGESLAGLQHLHSLKILHRDVKSKNLFLSSRGVKAGTPITPLYARSTLHTLLFTPVHPLLSGPTPPFVPPKTHHPIRSPPCSMHSRVHAPTHTGALPSPAPLA